MDFEKPITIVKWNNDAIVATLPPTQAYAMMGRSTRWDTNHATAAVRLLDVADARHLCFPQDEPVTFRLAERDEPISAEYADGTS